MGVNDSTSFKNEDPEELKHKGNPPVKKGSLSYKTKMTSLENVFDEQSRPHNQIFSLQSPAHALRFLEDKKTAKAQAVSTKNLKVNEQPDKPDSEYLNEKNKQNIQKFPSSHLLDWKTTLDKHEIIKKEIREKEQNKINEKLKQVNAEINQLEEKQELEKQIKMSENAK